MISPDLVFLLIAGLAFLGFVLDALFDRLRVTSILPLMLLGIALLYFHIVPPSAIAELDALLPYISALTVAFILFHVGLEIRFDALRAVIGRSLAFTLAVQLTTATLLSLLAYATFHWGLLISMIFGFALSGPSSVSVPVLVRVARMPRSLGTVLLFESVTTDLLQLLVPLLLVGLLISGNFSTVHLGETLALTLAGSAALGVAAAVVWLWILDRIGNVARAYSWTLTITMVLATYGIADYVGLSAAMTIFIFGLMIGNRQLFEFDPLARETAETEASGRMLLSVRRFLRLSMDGVDVAHIQQVQKEVSFFASAFFFVYIGLLFGVGNLSAPVVLVPLLGAAVMLAVRVVWSPLLTVYLDRAPRARRSERALVCFNIARGLSPAIIATIPLSYGLKIPGFLAAMFLGILFSTIVSTAGIFSFYESQGSEPPPEWEAPPETLPARTAGPLVPPDAPAEPPVRPPPPLPGPRGRSSPGVGRSETD